MKRIIRIGMDVHSTNYTLCAMKPIIDEDDSVKEYIRMRDDHKKALKKIKQQISALCL